METSDSAAPNSPPVAKISSDKLVDLTMKKGFEEILAKTTAGFIVGGVVGIIMARVGAPGARRAWAGLGAGIGLGSGWTRTSIELEKLVGPKDN
mmetsp:Transcript_487/g.874  ORF Transcript_487/g.874 Transcript_487/m.874 type:complete len:94 (+) Transcript_487:178-459(+)